jgi:hypothetical protein
MDSMDSAFRNQPVLSLFDENETEVGVIGGCLLALLAQPAGSIRHIFDHPLTRHPLLQQTAARSLGLQEQVHDEFSAASMLSSNSVEIYPEYNDVDAYLHLYISNKSPSPQLAHSTKYSEDPEAGNKKASH